MITNNKGNKPILVEVETKPLTFFEDNSEELSGVVEKPLNNSDKTDNKDIEAQLYIDAVFGCRNRRAYEETIKDYKTSATLFSIDGNNLKFINDTFSHKAGDFLLGTIAKAGMKVWGDNFYRTGGDEFLVFIPNVAQNDDTCSSQMKAFKAELVELNKEKPELPISASIGYSCTSSGVVLDTLLEEADKMMYEDKRIYKEQHPEYDMRRAKVTVETIEQAIKEGVFSEYIDTIRDKSQSQSSGVAIQEIDADVNLIISEDTPKKPANDIWKSSNEVMDLGTTTDLTVADDEDGYREQELNNKIQPILHETTKKAVAEAVKLQNDKLKLEVNEVLQDEVSYRLSRYEKRRRMRDIKEKIGFITKGVLILFIILVIFGNAQLRSRFALIAEDVGVMLSDILQGKETSSNKLVEDLFKDLGDDLNGLNTIETTEFNIDNED